MSNQVKSEAKNASVTGKKHLPYSFYSNKPNQVPVIAQRSRIAVIFKGSCVPLYSSPRTKGVSIPNLVLLICG